MGKKVRAPANSKSATKAKPKPAKLSRIEAISEAGFQAAQQGDVAAAVQQYLAVLQEEPDHLPTLKRVGDLLIATGQMNESLLYWQKATAVAPNDFEATAKLAICLAKLKQFDAALPWFEKATKLQPESVDNLANYAAALQAMHRYQDAEQVLRSILLKHPEHARSHHNMGVALTAQGRVEEAIIYHREAVRLAPDKAIYWHVLAFALEETGQLNAAEDALRQAVAIAIEINSQAQAQDSLTNLGALLDRLGRSLEALPLLNRVLLDQPDHAGARFNKSLIELRLGHFVEGFRLFEARFDTPLINRREYQQAPWRGEDLVGKTLFVHAEQGFGDVIHFSRYLRELVTMGATVYFDVAPELNAIMKSIPGITVFSAGESIPAFDYHCSLLSVPFLLGDNFDICDEHLPVWQLDQHLNRVWKEKIAGISHPDKPNIGFVWGGNKQQKNDRFRSVGIDAFKPLLALPDYNWVSLQKGEREPELERARGQSNTPVINLMPEVDNFVDTAALLNALDLVITVDTSVAHLAASLGRPTWVLVPAVGFHWVYMEFQEETPWYPAMRLFRQAKALQWQDVIEHVSDALLNHAF